MTMTPKEWEDLCDGCGKCCAFGSSNVACPSFNVKTRRCMNYDKRLETEICSYVRPSNVLSLHGRGILPDSCAYVRHMKKEPPLEVIEEAALIPFALAPLSTRMKYKKARKKWLRRLKPMHKAIKKSGKQHSAE